MKKTVTASYDSLIKPAPAQVQATAQEPAEKVKGNYKTVCYSIPPETADKIRAIASWDRRKINAVVAEAFEQYAQNWKPSKAEPPKF